MYTVFERFCLRIANRLVRAGFRFEALGHRILNKLDPIYIQDIVAAWDYDWEMAMERD